MSPHLEAVVDVASSIQGRARRAAVLSGRSVRFNRLGGGGGMS